MAGDASDVEAVALRALRWLVDQSVASSAGIAWPEIAGTGEPDFTLYGGTPGVVVGLLEAYRHFRDDQFADLALRGARALAAEVDATDDCSLYFGLTGMAFALRATGEVMATDEFEPAVAAALSLVRSRCQDGRWGEYFELLEGNAGIALGALALGDPDLGLLAADHYRHSAERTVGGVTWQTATMFDSRLHHISHGTLGIALALAATATATGHAELLDLALAGVADVVSRAEGPSDGFLVPHSDPQLWPDRISRLSYGWCHGPVGDAQVFRYLRAVTENEEWSALVDRCWHTVTHSGLPVRIEPGFWDNNGHCCGTAGVLAFAIDRVVDDADDGQFASVLVGDLVARANKNGSGVSWSNVEHRAEPSTLEPSTGWASGSAGIIIELLRWIRLTRGENPSYAVRWPDHPSQIRPDRAHVRT